MTKQPCIVFLPLLLRGSWRLDSRLTHHQLFAGQGGEGVAQGEQTDPHQLGQFGLGGQPVTRLVTAHDLLAEVLGNLDAEWLVSDHGGLPSVPGEGSPKMV